MKAFILIFAALIVLVTICETRPLVFVAIQNKTVVKSDSNQIGNVVGYVTIRKGFRNFRLRMFGIHSLRSNIREAWVADSDGNKHFSLRIGNDSSAYEGRYIFGDFYLNSTVSDYLLNHKLKVIISTNEYKDGVIGGYFMSKPITGFSIMTGDQVVPPVSTSRGGFAITVIEPAIANSTDIVDNVELIATNSSFGVSIVQTAGVARRASIYGMAGPGVNGVILHNLTHRESRYAFQFGMQTVPADFGVIDGTTYAQIFTPAWPNGAIRGNLEPVLKISRSLGVNQLDVIGGSTSIKPTNLSVLKNAKNVGSSTHTPGTVLGCKTNSTFQYVANFLFRAPVTRRNFALFRGVTLEASLKQNSTATWNFTLFDTDTGNHQTLGIFSGSSETFVRGLGHYAVTNTSQFITDLRRLVLRVSTTATEPAELIIDQLSLKGHVANGAVSDEVEAVIDNGSILSYKN